MDIDGVVVRVEDVPLAQCERLQALRLLHIMMVIAAPTIALLIVGELAGWIGG